MWMSMLHHLLRQLYHHLKGLLNLSSQTFQAYASTALMLMCHCWNPNLWKSSHSVLSPLLLEMIREWTGRLQKLHLFDLKFFLFSWYFLHFICDVLQIFGGLWICPAVLPPYLAWRLRSGTLRPTLSSGLPFSSFGASYADFGVRSMAVLLDGSLWLFLPGSSAALSLSRLRPVTLRAILSDGLPFSSVRFNYCNGYATKQHQNILRNINHL